MPKASRGMINREGHPSQPTRESREVVKLYNKSSKSFEKSASLLGK